MVDRLDDGSLRFTFTDLTAKTLSIWRKVATSHLIDAERGNRNLYDLRAVPVIPEKAIQVAIEVNSDAGASYVRIAVVAANEQSVRRLRMIDAASRGVELGIFMVMEEAEAWLRRPFSQLLRSVARQEGGE